MKKATIVCIVVVVLIFVAIIVTCVQASMFANYSKYDDPNCPHNAMRHVIALSDNDMNNTLAMAERFPYVAAVTRNSTTLWPFACFASVVLFKWIVTSAHCRRAGSSHRVLLLNDFAYNQTYAFPILFWRIHEKFNISYPTPKYDIAVAKLNLHPYSINLKPAIFDEMKPTEGSVEASVWKTVSTMDKRLYLTNSFMKYDVKIANAGKCFESYGIEVDDSLICVDTSDYDDCFIHEFGPIYSGEKLVGVLAVKPQDCDMKLSIFTNVSFYTNWILRTTYEG